MKKTLIVGLGNPILGDDGAGWKAAEQVERLLDGRPAGQIDVTYLSLGGLSLMENLIGYERAVIVDALDGGRVPPGTVTTIPLEDLPDYAAGHTTAAHDTSLQTALRLGRTMGAALPQEVWVVGIEARHLYEFSEALTPEVEAAVPAAAAAVVALLFQKERVS